MFTGPASTVSPTVDGIATIQENRIADATRSLTSFLSPIATALVRANLPEWCAGGEINTMEELERAVAV